MEKDLELEKQNPLHEEEIFPVKDQNNSYEIITAESYPDIAQQVIEEGLDNYFKDVSVSEAIHYAREFARITPSLEALGQSELAEKFEGVVEEYIKEYSEEQDESYLLGLYLEKIFIEKKEEQAFTVQKISPFMYGRIVADFAGGSPEIETVEAPQILETVGTLKEKDQKFKEYIEALNPREQNHIPTLLDKIVYYPDLLSDGTAPQTYLPWRELNESDLVRSEKSMVDQQDFQDFLLIKSDVMSGVFDEALVTNMSNQTLPEQFQLCNFLKKSSKEKVDKVKDLIQNYGPLGLEVFTALEQDPYAGDDILYLANALEPKMMTEVLHKYREIVRSAETLNEYLTRELDDEVSEKDQQEVQYNILLRARKVLGDIAQEVQGPDFDEAKTFKTLEGVKYHTVQFVESVKSIKGLDIETLRHISFESSPPNEIAPKEIQAMQEIYAENYQQSPQFQQKLLEGFDELLQKDTVQIHTFRDRGNIRGFYILDYVEEGQVDFKAFNIDSSYQGARLGEELMLRGLDQAARENVIHAQCDGDNFISSAYIERGFVATDVFKTTEDGPQHALEIIRDDRRYQQLETKKLTQDEIKMKAIEQGLGTQKDTQKFFIKSRMSQHDYMLLHSENNWILTRSISDRKTGEVYLAYERLEEE